MTGRGKRARIYRTEAQRAAAAVPGSEWTPPGFPRQREHLSLRPAAPFISAPDGAITHGGLSLDEVIVPLSRIM